jgi:hypothetical protein
MHSDGALWVRFGQVIEAGEAAASSGEGENLRS